MTPERSKAEAKARIARALVQIEEAQNLLSSACADLSAVVGGIPVWRATSKLYDKVKALWYRVEDFRMRGKFHLDAVNVEAIERRERFKGPAPVISSDHQPGDSHDA
jgi:hypothetical protein